ncbi:MAG TPA: NUDIX hydrolase [Methylocystis sp.]|nr:NUDIX hydrolase [Methylocystis sp.]
MSGPKPVKKKRRDAGEPRRQYAALPWRLKDGPEILLLTSRDTRRWVIPKGWPMKGRKPFATAALEALQEAGLLGKIDRKPLGAYHYRKRLKNGAALFCRVDVFALRVTRQRRNWPEKNQRTTQWFSYEAAAEEVAEEELQTLIRDYGAALASIQNA